MNRKSDISPYGFIAGFGLVSVVVSALIVVERLGKSIRTPSRDTMLASASSAVGRGRGFALHEALDQVGAVAGPLIVAGILWATSYGVFSAFTGVGTLLGGTIAGALYAGAGTTSLVAWALFVQTVVLVSLLAIFRTRDRKG